MSDVKLGIYNLVDLALERKAQESKSRDYIGGSVLGEECSAKMWWSYHHPKPITDARVNRIFRLGNIIEDEVIELLRMAGLTVYTEMDNGDQFGFVDGVVAGHIDGVVTGLPESTKPHLLEIKSAKSTRFKEFEKKGYKCDSKYWTQIQVYMRKMNLDKALVVIYNKDTSELLFLRYDLEKRFADSKISRGKAIAEMQEPPMRIATKPTFYKCKWCDYSEECWREE